MISIPQIPLNYDENRIYERIHVEPDSAVYELYSDIFPDILQDVQERLRRHVCVALPEQKLTTGVPAIDGAKKQVVCLVAIEQNVMDRMDEYLKARDLPEAHLLDALVNDILFAAGDDLCAAAAALVKEEGLGLSERFIPGDEPLTMDVQPGLLACFAGEPEAACISINERGVVWPEKTCLYVFGADPSYLK